MARAALFALAGASVVGCGPRCVPGAEPSSPPVRVIDLPDGGREIEPMPIAIYGTPPPICKPNR